MQLANKVAVVTGSSRGIGAAIARRLCSEGARVTITGRDTEALTALAQELQEAGGIALPVTADIATAAGAEAVVRETEAAHGPVDLLVNNAGVGFFQPVSETTLEQWQQMFDVNVTATFLCVRAVLPGMIARRDGCIVNVCSDVSRYASPGGVAYSATKHAQYAFTNGLGHETRQHGIRVGAVLPGIVDTAMSDGAGGPDKSWMLTADDIARAVIYVATQPEGVIVNEVMLHPPGQPSGL